jgi:hypothetical protein
MGKLPPVSASISFRRVLASALSTRRQCAKEVEEARAAILQANHHSAMAEGRLAEAHSALDEAKQEHVHQYATAGNDTAPDQFDLIDHRHALAAAEDQCTAAQEAVSQLEEKLQAPLDRLARSEKWVRLAASALLSSQAASVLKEAQHLQAAVTSKRVVLLYLQSLLEEADEGDRRRIISECAGDTDEALAQLSARPQNQTLNQVSSFLAAPLIVDDWRTHPALRPWRYCLDALMDDADAELPRL